MSVPDIAIALLAEYEIVPALRLDRAAFPRHEYRVQYGETDLAFLSRLLEEAGIAFVFADPDASGTLRFAERIVICDGGRFDTLVAIPL